MKSNNNIQIIKSTRSLVFVGISTVLATLGCTQLGAGQGMLEPDENQNKPVSSESKEQPSLVATSFDEQLRLAAAKLVGLAREFGFAPPTKDQLRLAATNLVDLANKNGFEPLTIEGLIANRADVNQENKEGDTLFHVVAERDLDVSTFFLLMENQAEVFTENGAYYTGLELVGKCSSKPELIKLLFKAYNVDLNWKNKEGDTFTHIVAAYNRHPGVITELYNQNVNINETNNDGWTVVHLAARHANLVAINELRMLGALNKENIDTKDNTGKTPLLLVAEARGVFGGRGDDVLRVMQLLIAQGANLHEKDNDRNTVSHLIPTHIRDPKIIQDKCNY